MCVVVVAVGEISAFEACATECVSGACDESLTAGE